MQAHAAEWDRTKHEYAKSLIALSASLTFAAPEHHFTAPSLVVLLPQQLEVGYLLLLVQLVWYLRPLGLSE